MQSNKTYHDEDCGRQRWTGKFLNYHPPPAILLEQREAEVSFNVFIGLEDGDRLTVFFKQRLRFSEDWTVFQVLDYKRAFLGLAPISSGSVFIETFLERKKLIDIGFNRWFF